jgi:hypothetical protein
MSQIVGNPSARHQNYLGSRVSGRLVQLIGNGDPNNAADARVVGTSVEVRGADWTHLTLRQDCTLKPPGLQSER